MDIDNETSDQNVNRWQSNSINRNDSSTKNQDLYDTDENNQTDDSTMQVTNDNKEHILATRATLKLTVNCCKNLRAAVHKLLQEFMTNALPSDSYFGFRPWYHSNNSSPMIKKADDTQKNITLYKYIAHN